MTAARRSKIYDWDSSKQPLANTRFCCTADRQSENLIPKFE
jgi:hypothetical protein